MNNGLYMSINPIAISKIESKIKTYEFRNYIPKNKICQALIEKISLFFKISQILQRPSFPDDNN